MVLILAGCGGDDDSLEDVPIANFVSATPPGGCVPPTITVTFDNPPRDLTVSVGLSQSKEKQRLSRVPSRLVLWH